MRVEVKRDGRGVWYARPYLGKLPSGRVAKPYKSFPDAETREQAQAMADEWAAQITAGGRVSSMLLSDLLLAYNREAEAMGASPHSVRNYALYRRRYLDRLAARRADELSPMDVDEALVALLASGGKGGAPLSSTTVRCVRQYLAGAYAWMRRKGIVAANPVLDADKPAPEHPEAVALGEADLRTLSEWIAQQMSGEADAWAYRRAWSFWMALHFGLRVGEVCALRPRDVEQARCRVLVSGTVASVPGRPPWRKDKPKTSKSRRAVAGTRADMAVIDDYVGYRIRELGCGQLAPLASPGSQWMRPSDLSAEFARTRDMLGLDRRATFHSLRHTHASWLIASGVDLVTISERLGHADPSVTAKVYAHYLDGRDAGAAASFEAAVRSLRAPSGPAWPG